MGTAYTNPANREEVAATQEPIAGNSVADLLAENELLRGALRDAREWVSESWQFHRSMQDAPRALSARDDLDRIDRALSTQVRS